MLVLAVVIAYAAAQATPGLRGAVPLDAASTSETADQGRVGAEIMENGLKEGLEEECKNNFAWDHVIIDGAPGHYRLYSNDHGKFVLDDMFPDWN